VETHNQNLDSVALILAKIWEEGRGKGKRFIMKSTSLLVKPKGKMKIPPTMVGIIRQNGTKVKKPYSKKKNRKSNKV